MKKTAKNWTIVSVAGVLLAIFAVITGADDVARTVDPYVYTEAEADAEHLTITMASEQTKQTQAGFNAYTLKQLILQEVALLEMQIEIEADEDELELLKIELAAKKDFIRELEAEQRRQMMGEG